MRVLAAKKTTAQLEGFPQKSLRLLQFSLLEQVRPQVVEAGGSQRMLFSQEFSTFGERVLVQHSRFVRSAECIERTRQVVLALGDLRMVFAESCFPGFEGAAHESLRLDEIPEILQEAAEVVAALGGQGVPFTQKLAPHSQGLAQVRLGADQIPLLEEILPQVPDGTGDVRMVVAADFSIDRDRLAVEIFRSPEVTLSLHQERKVVQRRSDLTMFAREVLTQDCQLTSHDLGREVEPTLPEMIHEGAEELPNLGHLVLR
jgi:hypothetical protein